jgi:tRNA(fMet)-specific endonuclease VapC
MYCLDTNVVIRLVRAELPFIEKLRLALSRDEIALSSIVLFELEYGVAGASARQKSDRRARNEERLAVFLSAPIAILPFDAEDAREAGDIRAHLARAGTPIGPYDVLIAAQARRRGAILVTANAREFARVPRLQLEDWSSPPP